jgi:hypothetical protein
VGKKCSRRRQNEGEDKSNTNGKEYKNKKRK